MPETVQMNGACGFCPPCAKDMLMCEEGFCIAVFQSTSDAKWTRFDLCCCEAAWYVISVVSVRLSYDNF